MQTLQTCVHSGVVRHDPTNHWLRNRSAHLRKGDLTRSSGPLSVLMAMMSFGFASKAYVRDLPDAQEGDLLEPLWVRARDVFFAGAEPGQILTLLDAVERYVSRESKTGSMRKVLAFTLARLAANDLVLLGFGEAAIGTYHWTLAVGVESEVSGRKREATGVLCLDAAEAAPMLAAFNARLELDSPKRGASKLSYRGADGRVLLVTCTSAIALSRR